MGQLPPLPLEDYYTFLRRHGQWDEHPDDIALVCAANGFRELTYSQLGRRISGAAHALRGVGFAQGDVLHIHSHNAEQFVVGFLAATALGGTITASNPAYTASELAALQLDANPKLVLASRAYETVVNEALDTNGGRLAADAVHFLEDDSCFANAPPTDLPLPQLARPICPRTDVLALPYSSGTTDKPKGVMLSHANLQHNVAQVFAGGTNATDRTLCVLPLFHVYGMSVLMGLSLSVRARLVLLPRFEPVAFLEAMEKHRITLGLFVPPILLFLANDPRVQLYDLSALKRISSGGDSLPPEVQTRLATQLGIRVEQGYGLSEIASTASFSYAALDVAPGSAGRLCPGNSGMIIDAQSGESLPAGQVGELVLRGPSVMLGYHGRPEATAEMMRPDSFLRTGDLASYDEKGNLFLHGRLKELIKVKGLQVSPVEVESRLLELPQVADAAVIGVADARSGQLPKAFVVLRPGQCLTVEDAVEALRPKLAEYKLPATVVFVDAIPKSPAGKILRRVLHDL